MLWNSRRRRRSCVSRTRTGFRHSSHTDSNYVKAHFPIFTRSKQKRESKLVLALKGARIYFSHQQRAWSVWQMRKEGNRRRIWLVDSWVVPERRRVHFQGSAISDEIQPPPIKLKLKLGMPPPAEMNDSNEPEERIRKHHKKKKKKKHKKEKKRDAEEGSGDERRRKKEKRRHAEEKPKHDDEVE